MNLRVVDSHSHIAYETEEEIVGKNIMMPCLPVFSEYEDLAHKNSVDKVLFAPCTSPMIINKVKHFTKVYYLWEYINGKYEYFSVIVDNGKILKMAISQNPYKEVNEKIYNYLKKLRSDISVEFIPAISLYFDTPQYIEKILSSNFKGVKVHGISTGIYDLKKINTDILLLLKKYNVPLVIHTDYFTNPKTPIEYLYCENNPINWLRLLLKYEIKGYLVHGCRLSSECSRIMKDNKGQFLTGISPDILLQNEPNRLMSMTNNYLDTLLNIFDIDMVAFDLDYNWNYTDRITYAYDDCQLKRMNELHLKDTDKVKILKKNSENFFNL